MFSKVRQLRREAGPFLRRLWDGGTDWVLFVGVGFLVAGAWQLSQTVGMIVLGIFLLVAAAALAWRPRHHR